MVKLSELTTFKEIISQFLVLADLWLILLLLIFKSSAIRTLLGRRRKKKEKTEHLSLWLPLWHDRNTTKCYISFQGDWFFVAGCKKYLKQSD